MQARIVQLALVLVGCTLPPLDLSDRRCPCADGWRCEADRCVLGSADAGSEVDAGEGDRDAGTPDGGADAGNDAGGFETYVRECEDGLLVGTMVSAGDLAASGGRMAYAPPGASTEWFADGTNLPPDRVEHELTLTTGGTYWVWMRVLTPAETQDALYLGFDPSDLRRFFDREMMFDAYRWASPPELRFDALEAGVQTLSIGPGEPGARCDRIVLTNDPAFDPTSL